MLYISGILTFFIFGGKMKQYIPAKLVEFYKVEIDHLIVYGIDKVAKFNFVAKDIWILIDGKKTVKEIAQNISELYKIEYTNAYDDLIEILKQFENNKLIVLNWDSLYKHRISEKT